jgi:thiosulfate/3-mercaptopyruvate sulfurtransferase
MIDNSPLISCELLQGMIESGDVRVVDCRFSLDDPGAGLSQYLDGHLPNAVFADLDKDLSSPVTAESGRHPLPEPRQFARVLGRLGISNSTHVVAYDQANGALAARLWWLLRWAGHEKTSILDGGISRWQALGLPLEKGMHEVVAAEFDVKPNDDLVLRTEEIIAARPDARALRLVDVRESARFRGEMEPIDPVAGHIPGTINLPFAQCSRDDGTWRDAQALLGQLQDALDGDTGQPWSVMCGSGVTACHLVVSALLAGTSEPRVYVGSWSEWIRDPARPIARVAPGGE